MKLYTTCSFLKHQGGTKRNEFLHLFYTVHGHLLIKFYERDLPSISNGPLFLLFCFNATAEACSFNIKHETIMFVKVLYHGFTRQLIVSLSEHSRLARQEVDSHKCLVKYSLCY